MQRFGQVIHLKPDQIAAYEALHAAAWPDVLALIHACNIRNYSIFRHGTVLFACYEYVGNDYAADMAHMAADPTMQAWWALTESMQQPLAERDVGTWWHTLPEVFHLD